MKDTQMTAKTNKLDLKFNIENDSDWKSFCSQLRSVLRASREAISIHATPAAMASLSAFTAGARIGAEEVAESLQMLAAHKAEPDLQEQIVALMLAQRRGEALPAPSYDPTAALQPGEDTGDAVVRLLEERRAGRSA